MKRFWTIAALAVLATGCLGPARRRPLPPAAGQPAAVAVSTAGVSAEVLASSFTLLCTGDVMLAHRFVPFLKEHGPDYPFARLAPVLEGADVMFLNLEVPVGVTSEKFVKKYNFLMAPRDIQALVRLKPRLVAGLANNHILDQGPVALAETFLALDHQGIARCGAGRNLAEARTPAWLRVNNSSAAFLAYSHTQPEEFYAGLRRPGTAFADEAAVRRDVAAAKAQGARVIVAFHWGKEYSPEVFPHQVRLARAAVESGADLVVGHHAHTVQGSEIYQGKPIVYGLGNFIFGTANDKAKGAVLRVFFQGAAASLELVPLEVNNFKTKFQTQPFAGRALRDALEEVAGLSPSIPWRAEEDRLVWP